MAKHPTDYYLRAARKSGKVEVIMGSKHIKLRAKDPPPGEQPNMMIPHVLKGDGTERAIVKWLVKMGVLLATGVWLVRLIGGF